ncbi:Glutamate transport ATP-binding protein GluA [Bienertia sinuspersici]
MGNAFKEISSNLTELRKQLNQLDYEGSEITTVTEDPSEQEVGDLEDEAEVYIKNLLVTSGLYNGSWVKSFSRWDPYVKPMPNWVYEKVEGSYHKPTDYENEAMSYEDCSLEHKILFDLSNEALTVALGPPRTLSKFRRKINESSMSPHPQGRKLLEQVWKMVSEYLYPSSFTSSYSFDDLVAHDLHFTPWSSLLDEETSAVGKELEYQITGDLMEELLMDMQL